MPRGNDVLLGFFQEGDDAILLCTVDRLIIQLRDLILAQNERAGALCKGEGADGILGRQAVRVLHHIIGEDRLAVLHGVVSALNTHVDQQGALFAVHVIQQSDHAVNVLAACGDGSRCDCTGLLINIGVDLCIALGGHGCFHMEAAV